MSKQGEKDEGVIFWIGTIIAVSAFGLICLFWDIIFPIIFFSLLFIALLVFIFTGGKGL